MSAEVPMILYVDDVDKDLERYSTLLADTGILHVRTLLPPLQLRRGEIENLRADLYLIDYELTRIRQGGGSADYRGGTFANLLRESYPEHPIVLLTTPGLLRLYGGAQRQLGSVDELVFKHKIEDDPTAVAESLLCIIEGFADLRGAETRNREQLLRLLGADESEEDSLREAAPPLEGLTALEEEAIPRDEYGQWRVSELAHWVRQILLEYPGILYDDLHASTSLGIAVSSFLSSAVQDFFGPARYSGVFSSCAKRWWRGRLQRMAYGVVKEAGLRSPISATFASGFKQVHGATLEPSTCIWSGEPNADAVCYIRRKPVRSKFALDYFPDDRPAVMDVAVVSYLAIQEDNRVIDSLFSEVGQEMLADIRKLERPRDG